MQDTTTVCRPTPACHLSTFPPFPESHTFSRVKTKQPRPSHHILDEREDDDGMQTKGQQDKEREIKLLEIDLRSRSSELKLERDKSKSYQEANQELLYQIEQHEIREERSKQEMAFLKENLAEAKLYIVSLQETLKLKGAADAVLLPPPQPPSKQNLHNCKRLKCVSQARIICVKVGVLLDQSLNLPLFLTNGRRPAFRRGMCSGSCTRRQQRRRSSHFRAKN